MAGIYLHIPFCKTACHYCNFHFSTSLKRKNEFVVALLKEMEMRRDYIGEEPVETIYFGGGTPSLLAEEEIKEILDRLYQLFPVQPDTEITLEANPDDITPTALSAWKRAGINRLSMGIQSFFEEDLRWMNRAHSATQARDSITQAQTAGLSDISIDLIYGTPGLTDQHWEKNVREAISLGIPHLSCYALTVEPRTALDKMIRQHKKEAVDPEDQARQFILLMNWMEQAGYEHYEISNFARPGKRSRHNSSYWQGKPYLGLGPSAHSYNGHSRSWNIANNALYIDHLQQPSPSSPPPFEKEELTRTQQLNEYIMISLRTREGCDLVRVEQQFGQVTARELQKHASPYIRDGKIQLETDRLVLTREGRLLADGIAADLFFTP